MPKPVIAGKGNELILISSDQSWLTPLCWLPSLQKEPMLRKGQSRGCVREGKIAIAQASGMILVCGNREVNEW